jgi:hypothetical protein
MTRNLRDARSADALWNTRPSYLLPSVHSENGVDKYSKRGIAMATTTITNLIPKMTDVAFKKNLNSIGLSKYTIISQRSVILYGPTKSRSDRAESLKEFANLLEKYGAKYSKVTGGSKPSPGFVMIGSTKFELKPVSSGGGIILKPGLFGTPKNKIVDTDIPFLSYASRVISAIESTSKLTDIQKNFLITLVEYTSSPSNISKLKIQKMLVGNMVGINLSTINNDFGEVLGPIAIMAKGLLPIDSKSAIVNIPGRSNEPLLDYKITDKNREFKISAKSGEATNTLKPGDVLNLINADKKLIKKWKNTPQYSIIEILDSESTKQGPISAGMWMKKNGFKKAFGWLKDDNYTEEVRQKCEDTIVQVSREELDFTSIFADATNTKIFYIKFKMGNDGSAEWKLVETPKEQKEQDKLKKRVTFRSKNYVGRPGDKLGFQV